MVMELRNNVRDMLLQLATLILTGLFLLLVLVFEGFRRWAK